MVHISENAYTGCKKTSILSFGVKRFYFSQIWLIFGMHMAYQRTFCFLKKIDFVQKRWFVVVLCEKTGFRRITVRNFTSEVDFKNAPYTMKNDFILRYQSSNYVFKSKDTISGLFRQLWPFFIIFQWFQQNARKLVILAIFDPLFEKR